MNRYREYYKLFLFVFKEQLSLNKQNTHKKGTGSFTTCSQHFYFQNFFFLPSLVSLFSPLLSCSELALAAAFNVSPVSSSN